MGKIFITFQTTVFLVSQLHLSPLQSKPFTPILGETFVCNIGDLEVYQEETLHKPPTSSIYAVSKNYKITGFIATNAATGANSVKAGKSGEFIITFADGTQHECIFPQVSIKGTTVGKRLFNFKKTGLVIDRKNNLASFIKFNPDEKSGFGSIFSSKQKTYPDTFRGDIVNYSNVKIDKEGKCTLEKNYISYCKIEGEWTNHLLFDDIKYWYVKDYQLIQLSKPDYMLPSDSMFREDLKVFCEGNEERAQQLKEQYEEKQRQDRKLRGHKDQE
jgi:hypothetical protein